MWQVLWEQHPWLDAFAGSMLPHPAELLAPRGRQFDKVFGDSPVDPVS